MKGLQRREALQVFHEICDSIPDANLFAWVSLTSFGNEEPSNKSYELKIRTGQKLSDLKEIRSIVEKHGLFLEESDKTLTIRTPPEKSIGIRIVA